MNGTDESNEYDGKTMKHTIARLIALLWASQFVACAAAELVVYLRKSSL